MKQETKTQAQAVWCYLVEAAKMGVRMGSDVAGRMTVTLNHGPVSVTIAPKEKTEAERV